VWKIELPGEDWRAVLAVLGTKALPSILEQG
jgi:hypothetical protein